MTTLSLVENFKQKLLAGKYTENDIKSLRGALEVNTDPASIAKLKVLDEYQAGTLTASPTIVTGKEIKLNTTEEITIIEAPDTSDIGVAKKFVQVYESARRRGIEFNLTLSDVRVLIKKTKCHYSGLKYDYTDPEKSPSFDRLDSKKGYVKGNVVSCRKDINSLKNVLIEHPVSVFKDNVKLLQKVVDKWVLGE